MKKLKKKAELFSTGAHGHLFQTNKKLSTKSPLQMRGKGENKKCMKSIIYC